MEFIYIVVLINTVTFATMLMFAHDYYSDAKRYAKMGMDVVANEAKEAFYWCLILAFVSIPLGFVVFAMLVVALVVDYGHS